MAMFKWEVRVMPWPDGDDALSATPITRIDLEQWWIDEDIPGKAQIVGLDADGIEFQWKRQLTPEEEEAELLRRVEEQRRIDEEEQEDREAGF